MKKGISLLIIFTLIIQFTGFSFAYSEDTDIKNELNKIEEKKALEIKRIKKQLKQQGAIEHLPIYKRIIENEYQSIKKQIKNKDSNKSTNSITPYSSAMYFPSGGEVSFSNTYGSTYVGKTYIQYIAPDETSKIISGYREKDLTTWKDALYFVLSFGLSAAHPAIGFAVGVYGGGAILSNWLTSDTIRAIESGNGASKIVSVESHGKKSTVWSAWDGYAWVSIPNEDTYHKNVDYEIY